MPSRTTTPSPIAETEAPPHPLYNTSYTLHRLSPLHHARSTRPFLSDTTLAQHAQRLTSILRGDVLRGVSVGIDRLNDEVGDEEGLGRGGALRGCEWTVLREEGRWREGDTERTGRENGKRTRKRTRRKSAEAEADVEVEVEEEEEEGGKAAGIHVFIRYEKTTYTAILLRASPLLTTAPESQHAEDEQDDTSTHLPLLLTRMPAPLRATLSSYLTSTFDCRVSALRLSSAFLCGALEAFLNDLQADDGDGSGMPGVDVKDIVKDIHLTLSFPPPVAPALKSLDIVVAAADVVRFVRAGEKSLRQQGQLVESDAPGSRSRKRRRVGADGENGEVEGAGVGMGRGAFMVALGRYLEAQLAMSVERDRVQVVKVACGGFVLAGEGRVRVVDLRRGGGGEDGDDGRDRGEKAMRGLVARLVGRAAGRMGGEREDG